MYGLDDALRECDDTLTLLCHKLQESQQRMKHFVDKLHTERTFEVEDFV